MSESISLTLPTGRGEKRLLGLRDFSISLLKLQQQIGFRVSSRGWCYQLEGFGLITKARFDKVENLINTCRKMGFLPIDFTAEEESRKFSGVEKPTEVTPKGYLKLWLDAALKCEDEYCPDWWIGEEYYIQMIVEKIDLKTLFTPVCEQYHIPIATTKGWSSMLQRAEYSRRFKEAEDKGLKCVLLYCGDHDPDGLRISDFLRSNLQDLSHVRWNDKVRGYDPADLIIDRFGLDHDFIEEHGLSWIENLITGSKKNLASPNHPNFNMDYVQDYLSKFGERKCEGNALIIKPAAAEVLCRASIEKYVGAEALGRFKKKRQEIVDELEAFRESSGLEDTITQAIEVIEEAEEEEETEE